MILVEIQAKGGQRSGDWVVRNGAGGKILSRHRLKRRAVERARTEARKRNTNYRVQAASTGQWRQGPGFGGR